MRRLAQALGCAVLLGGPAVIAFDSGGYFAPGRLWAALVAWLLVVIAAVASPVALPRLIVARLALAGLALLTALTGLSLLWAPLAGPATEDLQRLLLYLGTLVAAAALLRGSGALRAVEPALLAGTLVVVAYGLSERLVPGLVDLSASRTANGRLEQPLTYWNAMGLLAAMGVVLAARVAGDRDRPDALRSVAAAVAAPLGLSVYLSFSRGALAAVAAGAVVLLLTAPTWPQLRGVAITVGAGTLAAFVSAAFDGVASLEGPLSTRETEGATVLAILLALAMVAAGLQARECAAERRGRARTAPLPRPRRAGWVAAGACVVLLAALAVAAAGDGASSSSPRTGATTERLGSVRSPRYAYWRVAARSFAQHPVIGVGSGGFRVEWLRERETNGVAKDAHSLYLETATELGLGGLAALGLLLGGLAACARRALASAPALAPGAIAGAAAWAAHATLDWDWEMPGVTLVALVLAGALIAMADGGASAHGRAGTARTPREP